MKIFIHIIPGIFLSLFVAGLNAQVNTFLYGSNFKPVESFEFAKVQKQVENKSGDKMIIRTLVREDDDTWNLTNTVKIKNEGEGLQYLSMKKGRFSKERLIRKYSRLEDGTYVFSEFSGETLIRKGKADRLVPLHLKDSVFTYFPNSKLKSISFYENNQVLWNHNWMKSGAKYIDNLIYLADKEPQYSYGNDKFRNFILSGIIESGLDLTEINDLVILGWVIMEDGSLEGIHVVSGKIKNVNNLLVKLVSELPGHWIPASLGGEPVRYYMTIPFNFTHHEGEFDSLEMVGGFLIWD